MNIVASIPFLIVHLGCFLVLWTVDRTHYALVVLSWLGIVWDIRGPSDRVLREGMSN